MWPFTGRAQLPIPDDARELLDQIPGDFRDDGCSNALDSLFGFSFAWACRIHDWYYCTRAWPAGAMTYGHKLDGDGLLKRFMRASLPLRWRWVRYLYKGAVFTFGGFGSYDSCGPEVGERCRHNLAPPSWMDPSATALY